MWRLRACQRCNGDLLSSGWDGSWTCLQCGSDTTNGRPPSQRQKPKAPTDSERIAGVLEGFLARLAAEGGA